MIRLILPAATLFASACENTSRGGKQAILLADRKAPLGWMYLQIYEDSSFKFISKGIREETEYSGRVEINGDTLHFTYQDSIPGAGTTAIVTDKSVSYIAGSYPESLKITLNKINK
jgi:hypothetical protein